jgi:O-acetyl-ADP-ribose deacetylase (regulator of RNase III)
MGTYKEVEGNLITLAQQGKYDVITHGCNCFCSMQAGIAPQMAKAFGCDKFPKEKRYGIEVGLDGLEHTVETGNVGDINKLGTIDYLTQTRSGGTSEFDIFDFDLTVVNSYTQYHYGRNHKDGVLIPVDYDAIRMCMRKINYLFKGKKIGLPKIGAGLAGGIWEKREMTEEQHKFYLTNKIKYPQDDIKTIIQEELKDCDVTIVIFKP